jgi:GT2 family glycosyltransferase
MTSRSTLVAIIVTHNRLAALRRALGAVGVAGCDGIVVVDMASTDGTKDLLADASRDNLQVVSLDKNLGGAAGFALGIQAARERFDPDWMVLMDDDAWPEPSAFRTFLARPRDKSCAYAAAVYTPHGHIADINRPFYDPLGSWQRFVMTLWSGKPGYYLSDAAYRGGDCVPVELATFVGFFLSRDMVETIGLPDRRFFLYCDDLDYCQWITAQGGTICFDPSLRFRHACRTFSDPRQRYRPLWKAFYAHRNGLILARRSAGRGKWVVSLALIVTWVMRALWYRGERRAYLRILGLACRDGLRADLSRPHSAVLSAARTTGCPTRKSTSPSAIAARLTKTTYKGSKTAG